MAKEVAGRLFMTHLILQEQRAIRLALSLHQKAEKLLPKLQKELQVIAQKAVTTLQFILTKQLFQAQEFRKKSIAKLV